MEYLSVDRMNKAFAVCERADMTTVELPLSVLPKGAKEGSVLAFDGGVYSLANDEEQRRKKRIERLQAQLFGDDE